MQPTLYSRRVTIQVYLFHAHTRVVWRSLKITLTQSKRRSTTYFSQHYSLKRSPRHSDTRSRRAGRTRLTVWSSTAVCCFYINNSNPRRFYYHTEYVHGEKRESHGGVKKTTSSLENCVGEIENVLIPLYPRICWGQLTNRETRVRAHGLPQCLLIKAWCWINKNSETRCV